MMEDQNNTNPEEEKKDNLQENQGSQENAGGVDRVEPVSPVEPVQSSGSYAQEASSMFGSGLNLGFINEKVTQTRNEIGKFVIGQQDMVDLLMISIFSNGHVLLEGVPGVAKTLTAKVLSKTLSVDFSRIQFTPDLMPSDVIGTSIFNLQNSEFTFKKGPVFSNIVLIDEINRAPAKTQAALFEVMEERQISYDGEVYKMDFPFLVLATQNPVEQEGTYNLPEAQLDRFLFKIKIGYPSVTDEEEILNRYKNNIKAPDLASIGGVFSSKDLQEIQEIVEKVKVENQLLRYIAQITDKTRNHAKLYLGGSPRASLSMLKSAKAFAAIRGRDFVIPDDVQFVAPHVLNHRLIMTPEAEMEGITTEDIIQEIIGEVEVPR
jgi:MoxR-like ATPase